MTDLIADQELTGTRDGLSQQQRRWRPVDSVPRSGFVIVHGVGEHSGRYGHVGRFLANRGHDVLAFDNRGHGQSGGARGHVDGFADFLDDVEDLVIERRQLGAPVVLMGHSLGGLISATYVAEGRPSPDLLVLSAPALSANVPRWQRWAAPALSRLAPRFFVKNSIDGELLSRDVEVQRAYRDDPLRVAGSTARLGHDAFTAMTATSAAIDRITVPTYVLHGADDELVSPSASAILERLPNVTRRLWPGLRHECLNEPEQELVLTELAEWVEHQLGLLDQQAGS